MIMSNQGVDHVIEKKKTNHVMVVLWENPPSFIDNFSGIKTCTCQSDRSDRSDPMTPAMTAMTRPLWPLICFKSNYKLISYPFK
ncbi:hypothetical protein L249_5985, partial [Ophiocordyceps polyrhachis-furcata BCC 54312]